MTLLSAADNADDWETLRTVMHQLRDHPVKVESFTDPMTYNNIGNAELDLGFEDASHITRAKEAFDKGIQITPAGRPDVLWFLHFNKWRYYLAVDDSKGANQEVEIAKNFDPPPDFDDWAKAENWAWFKAFFDTQHKVDKHEIERGYKKMTRTEARSEAK